MIATLYRSRAALIAERGKTHLLDPKRAVRVTLCGTPISDAKLWRVRDLPESLATCRVCIRLVALKGNRRVRNP